MAKEEYDSSKNYPSFQYGASFHGETWYKCPHCGHCYEYYDLQFERGAKRVAKGHYRCRCGKISQHSN